MIKITIGESAGLIWRLLNTDGAMPSKLLQKKTELQKDDFNMAIGWLARENKIHFFHRDKELFVSLND
jgi:hypothetical protein